MVDRIPQGTTPRRRLYRQITAQQFRDGLETAGLTLLDFTEISGSKYQTVQEWARGERGIPHHVTMLIGLLTLDGGRQLALDMVKHLMIPPEVDGMLVEDRRRPHAT